MNLLLLLSLVLSPSLQFNIGSCSFPTGKASFSGSDIVGKTYYVVRRTSNVPFDNKDCGQAQYFGSGNSLTAINYHFDIEKNKPQSSTGTLTFKEGGIGQIKNSLWLPSGEFTVLESNLVYLTLYSCKSFLWFFKYEYAWILSNSSSNILNPIIASVAELELVSKTNTILLNSIVKPKQGSECRYLNEN